MHVLRYVTLQTYLLYFRRPYNLYCVGTDVKPCSINYLLYLLTYLLHTITVDVVFYAVFNTTAMYTVSPFVS